MHMKMLRAYKKGDEAMVELEAQIASVDSFVSLYKNILRLIIQLLFRLLFSDDKRRNTGLGGTCEM